MTDLNTVIQRVPGDRKAAGFDRPIGALFWRCLSQPAKPRYAIHRQTRLVEEIRNKRGLAYSVGSFFDAGKYPGSFQIALQTKNSSAREAIALSLQGMERIRKELVSEKELEGAKKYLVGSFPMRLNTQGKLTSFLTQVEYYGLGLDYPEKYHSLIRSITREELLRVAKKYLHPKNIILVVVANLKEAGME